MDWIKRNWWVVLLTLLVGYFAYRYIKTRIELSRKMRAVRASRNGQEVETVTEKENEPTNES